MRTPACRLAAMTRTAWSSARPDRFVRSAGRRGFSGRDSCPPAVWRRAQALARSAPPTLQAGAAGHARRPTFRTRPSHRAKPRPASSIASSVAGSPASARPWPPEPDRPASLVARPDGLAFVRRFASASRSTSGPARTTRRRHRRQRLHPPAGSTGSREELCQRWRAGAIAGRAMA